MTLEQTMERIRLLAAGVPPGPWHVRELGEVNHWRHLYQWRLAKESEDHLSYYAIADSIPSDRDADTASADLEYLAAVDPTTVLALLDEIDRLRIEVKQQEAYIRDEDRAHAEHEASQPPRQWGPWPR